MIINAITRNGSNLLAGITPTAAGWDTQPATDAQITSELVDTLTTPGVQTNSVDSTLTYDLGSSQRIIATAFRGIVGSTKIVRISFSDDNNTYYTRMNSTGGGSARGISALGKARYVQFFFEQNNPGNTISVLALSVYKI